MDVLTLDEIWENHLKKGLTQKEIKDLRWHLDHDQDPHNAISLTAEMGLKELGSVLAKYLHHEQWFIRQLTLSCLLDKLELPEYAESGLEMVQYDAEENVRTFALFTLGGILNKVSFSLAKKIAQYLWDAFNQDACKVKRGSAYFSILKALDIPCEKRPRVARGLKESDINPTLLAEFCKKYQILNQSTPGTSSLTRERIDVMPHSVLNRTVLENVFHQKERVERC